MNIFVLFDGLLTEAGAISPSIGLIFGTTMAYTPRPILLLSRPFELLFTFVDDFVFVIEPN